MKTAKTLAAALVLILPALAAAQPSTPRIDARQDRQEARIERGVQSGALTEKEAAKLDRGQTHVQNLESRATADGVVSGRERARIEHAQDVQDRRIYREKHDRQHDFNHDGSQDRPRQALREEHRGAGQQRGRNR